MQYCTSFCLFEVPCSHALAYESKIAVVADHVPLFVRVTPLVVCCLFAAKMTLEVGQKTLAASKQLGINLDIGVLF
jgi:hypothetical protein